MSVEVERSVGNPPIFWYEDKKISADEAYDLHVSGTPFEERIYPPRKGLSPGSFLGRLEWGGQPRV